MGAQDQEQTSAKAVNTSEVVPAMSVLLVVQSQSTKMLLQNCASLAVQHVLLVMDPAQLIVSPVVHHSSLTMEVV